jgi:hypothetical protein
VDEDVGGIHARDMGNRLAGVLGRAGELERLGAVKCQQGIAPNMLSTTYRRNVVLVLIARFLFAYDCHLVNCAHYTRRTARQRYVSDTTQEHQGRLTPRRAAFAAALACLPVLVAANMLAMRAK